MTKKLLVISFLAIAMLAVSSVSPVMAQTTSPAATVDPADLACMQTAVEKRDNAIISAFDVFHTSVNSALTTRRDALVAAWGISARKDRRAAIKTAWLNFRTSARSATKTLRDSRNAAWSQFKTESQACRNQGAPADDLTQMQGIF